MHTISSPKPPSRSITGQLDAPPSALALEIIALHGEIITAARSTLDKAIRIGELLTEQKAQLKHGQWLPWVKGNLPFSHNTASRYMSVYARRDEISHSGKFELTDAYRLLAAPARTIPLTAHPATMHHEGDAMPWKQWRELQLFGFNKLVMGLAEKPSDTRLIKSWILEDIKKLQAEEIRGLRSKIITRADLPTRGAATIGRPKQERAL